MTLLRALLILVVAVGVVALVPTDARACSCSYWNGISAVPADGATVPANLPAVLIQIDPQFFSGRNATTPTLTRVDGSAPETVEVEVAAGEERWIRGQRYLDVLITPVTPLVAGARYRVDATSLTAQTVEFETAPAAPLPTGLGIATQVGTHVDSVPAPQDACADDVSAPFADLSLTLEADTLPWAEAMEWETILDGWDQRVGSFCQVHDVAARVEQVRADCAPAETAHVVFRGTIPGHAALSSAPLAIACSGEASTADAGMGDDAGPSSDDAGPSSDDAGPSSDDAGPSSGAGGGCSAAGGGPLPVGGLVLLAAVALLRRRRR